jgi:cytochrome d ubiquinol oxidase subunit II
MPFVPTWFILIAVLWTGFFILEGFDFGVGMLHGMVGRDNAGRRAVINTIGPLWDGNEVWLIVAGAAIFAAFPDWYATMFSGMYLAMVVLLGALIMRGVSFEYRGKSQDKRWRDTWSLALTIGSLLVPLLLGIALGDLLAGLPINASHEFTGTFWSLFQPYGIMTGVMLVAVCVIHGATFIAMKTTDEVRRRAWRLAKAVSPVTMLVVLAYISWTHVESGGGAFLNLIELVGCLAVIAAVWEIWANHEGWAFSLTTVTIASCVVTLFVDLYPHVMVSSTNPAYSLTAGNSASNGYTLKVMTVIAAVMLPVVLAYQAWTYHVFRRRVSAAQFRPAVAAPAPRQPPAPETPSAPKSPTAASPGSARAGSRRGRHRLWRNNPLASPRRDRRYGTR